MHPPSSLHSTINPASEAGIAGFRAFDFERSKYLTPARPPLETHRRHNSAIDLAPLPSSPFLLPPISLNTNKNTTPYSCLDYSLSLHSPAPQTRSSHHPSPSRSQQTHPPQTPIHLSSFLTSYIPPHSQISTAKNPCLARIPGSYVRQVVVPPLPSLGILQPLVEWDGAIQGEVVGTQQNPWAFFRHQSPTPFKPFFPAPILPLPYPTKTPFHTTRPAGVYYGSCVS